MYPDLQRREIKTTTAVPEETTQKPETAMVSGFHELSKLPIL